MGFHLYKMTLQGKIAVANLTVMGLAMLILEHGHGAWQRQISDVLETIVIVMMFPFGGFGFMCAAGNMSIGMIAGVCATVILNAYFWGYVVDAIVRRVKRQLPWTPPPDGPVQPGSRE